VHHLKISVITVSYNAAGTIRRCIGSVISQDYPCIEYIIIDGGSTDGTLDVIEAYKGNITTIVSEPDNGIYDAMNKGISLATGDIIGMLNADDFYAGENILSQIASVFTQTGTDALYGDLDYIDHSGNIIRKWRSGQYKPGRFNYGWMPPHPTFYCKKKLYDVLNTYSLKYGTAADYELMLRFIHVNQSSIYYLQKVLIKMTAGGVSNNGLIGRFKSLYFDFKAMQNNKISLPVIALLLKPISKLRQFF